MIYTYVHTFPLSTSPPSSPSFTAAFYANRFADEDCECVNLVWSRPSRPNCDRADRTTPRPDDLSGLSSVSNSFVMRTLGISPALSGDKLGPRCKLPNRNANPAQQGALFPRSQKCRAITGCACPMLIGRWRP